MADATDLKSVDRKVVWVRLPPSAPIISWTYSQSLFDDGPTQGVNSVACPNFAQIVEEKSHLYSLELAPSATRPPRR